MEERLRLWADLDAQEDQAWTANSEWLAPIEPAIELLHDLPNALTALPGFQPGATHTNTAGMCLKRCLDDLRAMWLLLNAGYTSAAAAVCADLWEHGVLASCCALSDEVATQFLNLGADDFSLGPSKLSSRLANLLRDALAESHPVSAIEAERWDASSYAAYKWLCQIKHPTLRALQHTTRSSVADGGVLHFAARPDSSTNDRSVKMLLLCVAFSVISESAILLGVAAVGNQPSPAVDDWQKQLEAADRLLKAHLPKDLKLPWSIGDTKVGKRSRELRAAMEQDELP